MLSIDIIDISARAFANNQLASLELNYVENIGARAFYNNNLKTAKLTLIGSIAADAFDGNQQVVAITANEGTTATSSFKGKGGKGHVVNPVTVNIAYIDKNTSEAIKGADVFGADFTGKRVVTRKRKRS